MPNGPQNRQLMRLGLIFGDDVGVWFSQDAIQTRQFDPCLGALAFGHYQFRSIPPKLNLTQRPTQGRDRHGDVGTLVQIKSNLDRS